jgi:hypothetical protein
MKTCVRTQYSQKTESLRGDASIEKRSGPHVTDGGSAAATHGALGHLRATQDVLRCFC